MNAVTTESAQLMSREGIAATLQKVHIEGQVEGLLLSMTTRQHYKNTGTSNLEAVYTFPLPWGATLLGLNAEIDGHRLQGTVMERKQATQRYEKAIDEGDTPIMVERSARGLFTANLGNLKPDETAIIEIEYAQLLRFEQGQIRITVPTTVAPRYGDAHQSGGLAQHESVDATLLVEYPLTVTITLHGELALASVQSPSHAVAIGRKDDALEVKLEQGALMDRDFVLQLQGLSGHSFVTVAPDGDKFAVLASFCPQVTQDQPEPLLLKILVDCSGSMGGDSIDCARRALHEVMQEMTGMDWVSYSRFGSDIQHELPGMLPCNQKTIAQVARLIDATEADLGGTEMNSALISTFEHGVDKKWIKQFAQSAVNELGKDILLITDGDIWNVEEVINRAKSSGHRIFAIGVGSAPGESLLRELADKTGGACELVAPNQNVAQAIVRMFRRMRSVRCSDIELDWGHTGNWQSPLPKTIYGGDTIHLCARLDAAPGTSPVLSWSAQGQRMTSSAAQVQATSSALLARVVASEQIKNLTCHDQESQSEGKTQALALALQYQLVTEQTNLLLVHIRAENEKAEGLPTLAQVAHMQAAGWGGAGSVHDGTVAFSRRSVDYSACESVESLAELDIPCMSAPTVWRSRDNSSAAAKVNALSAVGMDDFEIPAFLRLAPDESALAPSPIAKLKAVFRPKPRKLAQQPLATPLAIVQAFEASAQKMLAPHRFVRELQAMNLPTVLISLLDDLSVILGTGTKAWAVVLQWLAERLNGQFTLSRQSERLLRHVLKDEDGKMLQELKLTWAGKMDAVMDQQLVATGRDVDDLEVLAFLRKQAD